MTDETYNEAEDWAGFTGAQTDKAIGRGHGASTDAPHGPDERACPRAEVPAQSIAPVCCGACHGCPNRSCT